MSFTSGTYFVFLIAVFFTWWLVAGWKHLRVALLVMASAFFYLQTGIKPFLLLLAVSLIDFTTTRLMSFGRDQSVRRMLLGISLLTDLGTLCIFKYANFFIDSANSAFSAPGSATGTII